jgi:hypothetical protein
MLCRGNVHCLFLYPSKSINALCGKNVEFFDVKLVAHKVATGVWKVKDHCVVPRCYIIFFQ